MPRRLNQIIHSYVPIGLLLWLGLWLLPYYDQTERIILFAAFVVVPLTLFRLWESWEESPIFFLKVLIAMIPIGAIALAVSFALAPGRLAGLLSIPWSLVTFVIAAMGVVLFVKNDSHLATASRAVGLMYISVAGIWLAAHQFGLSLLGFEGLIMLLTVNHFHYAGFVVPVLFGFLQGHLGNRFLSSLTVVLGAITPILIALGMTYSPMLEWLSVVTFALSLVLYSVLVFVYVIPKATRWTKWFHLLSSGVIWLTMALAVLYGYGEWSGQSTISISTMITFHGWGNAVLFSFIGVLAWHATLMDRATAGIPFSRIQGSGKIGADIFAKLDVLDRQPQKTPTGLIDDMREYESPTLNLACFDRDLIDFYEQTDDFELYVTPHWSRTFVYPAKLYKLVSQWLEQMNFPLEAETSEQRVKSAILPIREGHDGRQKVRAWVRTYDQTKKAIYAALYSSHVSGGTRYMNIAFPLPHSQMTSILNLRNGSDDTLVLTSWPSDRTAGDQGVYLVLNQKAIRLPINETITVWKDPDAAKGKIEAKHDMWLFGMKFLTLDYHISKKAHGDSQE